MSKQYNVVVVRASSFEQGTIVFQRAADAALGVDADGEEPDAGIPINFDTGAGNDPDADTTNPIATGDFGPVGSNSNDTNPNTNGDTADSPPTTTTSPPTSYWTRARVNGQVSAQTADSSSPDYWTRARANGEVVTGDSSADGGAGGEGGSAIASGTFTADLSDQPTTGNWYSLDLGGFSLWYGSASSAGASTGSVYFAGYATPEIIVGRTSSGTGGVIEAMFNGAFFVGQAADITAGDELAEDE